MREIKFRGIYPHSGKFFFGFFVNAFPEDNPRIVGDGFSTPINLETLGQYTGLKDKNGAEIYEGDILKNYSVDDSELIDVVSFDRGGFVLTNPNKLSWPLGDYKTHYLEVIGNIYQNSELLTA